MKKATKVTLIFALIFFIVGIGLTVFGFYKMTGEQIICLLNMRVKLIRAKMYLIRLRLTCIIAMSM